MFFKILQNSQKNTRNFIKKETLAQVFSCEFYEIFKNTFFTEHLRMTASEWYWIAIISALLASELLL